MTTEKTTCDVTALSHFFDEELGRGDHTRIDKHLKHCSACQRSLRDDETISAFFKAALAEELSHAHLEERVLDVIRGKRLPWWMKLRAFFASKKFYVPAAAMATALILYFSVVKGPAPEPASAPVRMRSSNEMLSFFNLIIFITWNESFIKPQDGLL